MQILPDSFQRWHVSSAHSLLIPNVLEKNEAVLTKKIYYPNHMGVESIDVFKCKNSPNIQYIKNTYLVSLCMHIYKATYTKYK